MQAVVWRLSHTIQIISIRCIPIRRRMTSTSQKLLKFREYLHESKFDAFIIGSADAHQSEYVAGNYYLKNKFANLIQNSITPIHIHQNVTNAELLLVILLVVQARQSLRMKTLFYGPMEDIFSR